MDRFIVPSYTETKGSLFLRSNHMKYAEPVLTNYWHKAALAHPKDYDVNKHARHPERDLLNSTYKDLGHDTNYPQYKSTTHSAYEQRELKPDYDEKTTSRKMLDRSSYGNSKLQEEMEFVLPKHPAGHNRINLETTQKVDYQPPYPFVSEPIKPKEVDGRAFRKCLSQFTDVDNHRRAGNNTYHDESAVYANQQLKREIFKTTDPILQAA